MRNSTERGSDTLDVPFTGQIPLHAIRFKTYKPPFVPTTRDIFDTSNFVPIALKREGGKGGRGGHANISVSEFLQSSSLQL